MRGALRRTCRCDKGCVGAPTCGGDRAAASLCGGGTSSCMLFGSRTGGARTAVCDSELRFHAFTGLRGGGGDGSGICDG
eukprot:3043521-Pleurochrysis_carterae.AAC.2